MPSELGRRGKSPNWNNADPARFHMDGNGLIRTLDTGNSVQKAFRIGGRNWMASALA